MEKRKDDGMRVANHVEERDEWKVMTALWVVKEANTNHRLVYINVIVFP